MTADPYDEGHSCPLPCYWYPGGLADINHGHMAKHLLRMKWYRRGMISKPNSSGKFYFVKKDARWHITVHGRSLLGIIPLSRMIEDMNEHCSEEDRREAIAAAHANVRKIVTERLDSQSQCRGVGTAIGKDVFRGELIDLTIANMRHERLI